MVVDPTSNWLVLAASTTSGSDLMLLGLNLFNDPAQTVFPNIKVTVTGGNQVPYSLIFGSGTSFYAASFGSLPQTPPASSYSNCASLSQFSITSTGSVGGGTWIPTYVQTIFNAVSYYPYHMKYLASGLTEGVFLASDSMTAVGGILISKITQVPSFAQENYIYSVTDVMKTLDIMPKSMT
jgi:hypothetical protein